MILLKEVKEILKRYGYESVDKYKNNQGKEKVRFEKAKSAWEFLYNYDKLVVIHNAYSNEIEVESINDIYNIIFYEEIITKKDKEFIEKIAKKVADKSMVWVVNLDKMIQYEINHYNKRHNEITTATNPNTEKIFNEEKPVIERINSVCESLENFKKNQSTGTIEPQTTN